jgi:hypothetical protein
MPPTKTLATPPHSGGILRILRVITAPARPNIRRARREDLVEEGPSLLKPYSSGGRI